MLNSPLLRTGATALLVLFLQVPVLLIAQTIEERRATRDQAIDEVTRTWGGPQHLVGPIVSIPRLEEWRDDKGVLRSRRVLDRYLPRKLVVKGTAETEVRRRGIFDVPLYVARLHVEADFALPDARSAAISLGVGDPRAIRSVTPLALAPWESGPGDDDLLPAGIHAALPGRSAGPLHLAFDLVLSGSGRLAVVPVGDETVVSLYSSWPAPGFDGAWLPVERSVSAAGFHATWRILSVARNFASKWTGRQVDLPTMLGSAFGVTFVSPVDAYRMTDRAVKYQLLFLGLTFVCFMLVELLAKLRVHPVQYLLVGLTLCLFYLLLLSLSEQLGFTRAYAIAAGATVFLIGAYVRAVLATAGRALVVGGFLTALYGFLFVLLQIQDYALLVGSVGLFAVLATVMWLTRKIDWYQLTNVQYGGTRIHGVSPTEGRNA